MELVTRNPAIWWETTLKLNISFQGKQVRNCLQKMLTVSIEQEVLLDTAS